MVSMLQLRVFLVGQLKMIANEMRAPERVTFRKSDWGFYTGYCVMSQISS